MCPAGWGKMPKWRPATTLDSPTAGRRRRRLRPSIGNGSPLSPCFAPDRPAAGIPPTRRPRGRPRASPHPADPSPGPRRARLRGRSAPPRPARRGSAEPAAGRETRPRFGKARAAGALGGPGAKMASRGLGAEPSRPRRPAGPQSPPPAVHPHLCLPPARGMERASGGTPRSAESQAHRPPRQLPGPRPGASALGARRACRGPGCALHRRPCTSTAGVSGFLGPCRFPRKERCERTNHL